ncbi:MAG: 3-deoxy-D-manno-octulosonate 8-phosphate phosphatase [Bacteroidetes bacterium]|nr:MAG: 3-deoxy-D-manno-octulosonate 8-phosphate phosphatase [Bacteroidota bacterium]
MSLSLFSQITTLVFDVDGVLTDGTLWLMGDGEMVRRMNTKDGYALQLAVKRGYNVVIISGGKSNPVTERLYKLGVSAVFMGVEDKRAVLAEYMHKQGLGTHEILFMGDDMPDMEAMLVSALPCCPADACQQVKGISKYISALPGGMGCVRDVIEKVLQMRGHWEHHLEVSSR